MSRPRVVVPEPAELTKPLGRPRKYPEAKVGDRFGQWTVIAYWLPDFKTGVRRVCVKCDCGNWRVHRENTLLSGMSKSCGHTRLTPLGHHVVVSGYNVKRNVEVRRRKELLEEVYARVAALQITPLRKETAKENVCKPAPSSSASSINPPRVVSVAPSWHGRAPWPLTQEAQKLKKTG